MTLLTIFVGIIAFVNLVLLAVLVYLALMVRNLFKKQVVQTITEVTSTVKDVREFIGKATSRTEHILAAGEEVTNSIFRKLLATSDLIHRSISKPLISVSSAIEGIKQAVIAYRQISKGNQGGRTQSDKE